MTLFITFLTIYRDKMGGGQCKKHKSDGFPREMKGKWWPTVGTQLIRVIMSTHN